MDLTTDGNAAREVLEASASVAFGFLVGLGARASQDSDPQISRLSFVLPRNFVEVELDWKEEAVFVLVGELEGGEVPGGYYVDGLGRKVRWHLGVVLREGGFVQESERLRLATRKSGQQAMLEQISLLSEALESAVEDLSSLIQNVR